MGAAEESSKRVASEAQGPAGPPEGAVFEELFGRTKSSPPEAECPEGRKARAAGPEENNARRAKRNVSEKSPGRMAQREQRPEGERSRAAGPKKTFSVK